MDEPCKAKCVGAKCQVEGPHELHEAVVPYLDEKYRRQGYVRMQWPVDLPGKQSTKAMKTWENL